MNAASVYGPFPLWGKVGMGAHGVSTIHRGLPPPPPTPRGGGSKTTAHQLLKNMNVRATS